MTDSKTRPTPADLEPHLAYLRKRLVTACALPPNHPDASREALYLAARALATAELAIEYAGPSGDQ